jgi:hypothetical protein
MPIGPTPNPQGPQDENFFDPAFETQGSFPKEDAPEKSTCFKLNLEVVPDTLDGNYDTPPIGLMWHGPAHPPTLAVSTSALQAICKAIPAPFLLAGVFSSLRPTNVLDHLLEQEEGKKRVLSRLTPNDIIRHVRPSDLLNEMGREYCLRHFNVDPSKV